MRKERTKKTFPKLLPFYCINPFSACSLFQFLITDALKRFKYFADFCQRDTVVFCSVTYLIKLQAAWQSFPLHCLLSDGSLQPENLASFLFLRNPTNTLNMLDFFNIYFFFYHCCSVIPKLWKKRIYTRNFS